MKPTKEEIDAIKAKAKLVINKHVHDRCRGYDKPTKAEIEAIFSSIDNPAELKKTIRKIRRKRG